MQHNQFKLKAPYKPSGDQPKAIEKLTNGIENKKQHQTLLGVTGSGKTFSIANVIQNVQKPTLVLAHNKTLAAQLFAEFKEFFPENAVNYFISYYDYYQPEAYVASRDLYIEKETSINEDIEKYRNASTQALLTRNDVIIVASVSCIYGLGDPEDYTALSVDLKTGEEFPRSKLLIRLTDMQYYRSEYDFYPGLYRVRGENVDINLIAQDEALRIEFFGDEIESIKLINPISGQVIEEPSEFKIFPAKQFVTPFDRIKQVIPEIEQDLAKEIKAFEKQGKKLEAHRIKQRVNYDLEMLKELGYCNGIENYARYLTGRKPGTPPSTLLDYMPDDWLMVIDESHMTIPQVRGMYNGDRARKETLVNYGFRLQAALDNRPLKFNEFTKKTKQTIYVSATPADYEIEKSGGEKKIIEQIIRPTGLLDPIITIKPAFKKQKAQLNASLRDKGLQDLAQELNTQTSYDQIDDLLKEIKENIKKKQRVLVTTLTKRMSEELTNYLNELEISVQYIHSDIDAIERVEILRDLRLGKYDVVVGINLLREGLDLPEVSLVAILDADKEGFLRSETSFIQTIGRAARHEKGRVIMYADKVTGSMHRAIKETQRRRAIQEKYNQEHNITPTTIKSPIKEQLQRSEKKKKKKGIRQEKYEQIIEIYPSLKPKEKHEAKQTLKVQMEIFADSLEFEKAAEIRDFLKEIED